MRSIFVAVTLLALPACVSQTRNTARKDRPLVVRVGPNGYQLVEDDRLDADKRRECTIEDIVGSHIPKMVCISADERNSERIGTQNDFFIPRNCRDAKCLGN